MLKFLKIILVLSIVIAISLFVILLIGQSKYLGGNYPYFGNINYNEHDSLYKEISKKYDIDYKLIRAICYTETSGNEFMVNINNMNKNGHNKSYNFDSKEDAIKFVNNNDLENKDYDSGLCQINNYWFDKLGVTKENIFDKERNVNLSYIILQDNLNECNGNIMCALSMYNTGYKFSYKGITYATTVLLNKYKIDSN